MSSVVVYQKDNSTLKNQAVCFKTTIDYMNSLGTRVLLSRRDLGLTQDELARQTGVSRSHIANIENERVTNVGVEVIEALAHVLGVSAAYLAGYTDDPLANVEESALHDGREEYSVDDPYIKDIIKIMKNWSDHQKRQFVEWLRIMGQPPR